MGAHKGPFEFRSTIPLTALAGRREEVMELSDDLKQRRDEREYRRLMLGEFPAYPPITRIVANTLAQARLVAEQLQIPSRSWRLVRDRSDLFGVTLDHIAIADPPLGGMTFREAEINDELRRIQVRDGGEYLVVRT